MPRSFRIDPDITRASTPPSRVYHAPDLYALQKERIFARSWQFAAGASSNGAGGASGGAGPGSASAVRAPGHVLPFTLLPGCLDEPLVLTRDQQGALHCLSNVCTHRGALVVEGAGHVKTLRCRYHGRRFGLDGCFQHMPEFDDVVNFPSAADDLPRLALREWGGLLFTRVLPPASRDAEVGGEAAVRDEPTSHDDSTSGDEATSQEADAPDAIPFDAWIEPVARRVGWLPVDTFRFDASSSRDYLIECNWALYTENYLEEFHIPYVHGASLGGKLDYDAYHTELYDWGSLQIGVAKGAEPAFTPPAGHPDEGTRIAGWYFWLFPNLMLNFYPWGLSLNLVEPLGPGRTCVRFLTYGHDDSLRGAGAGGDVHRVEMEDEEVVESVQRGVRSRLYDRGRYSPRRETGTHHFHQLLARFMA
jgi:choline monooxygenase